VPGFLYLLGSALCGYFVFTPPEFSFSHHAQADWPVLLYLLSGLLVGLMVKQLISSLDALETSEYRFRTFMDNGNFVAWIKDEQGRHIYHSQPYEQRLNPQQEAWFGKTDYELFPLQLADKFRQNDTKTLDINQANIIEETTLDSSGKPVFWLSSKFKFINKQAKPFIGGIAIDITEYKQAEQAARQHLSLLNNIASRVPGVVFQYRLNPDGSSCFPYASEAIREIYRLSPEDVREDASVVFSIIHPEDLASVKVSLLHSARTLSVWNYEYRVKFSDDSIRWLLGNAVPTKDEQGAIIWHGFITDVTVRRELTDKLHTESAKNLAFLHNASDGIHILNAQGTLIEASDSFCSMLGYSRAEVIGMHVSAWDAGFKGEEALAQIVRQQLEKPLRSQFETLHRRKDGTILDVEVSGFPIELGGEKVLFNSSRDITERKHLMAALVKSEQEFHLLTEAMPQIVWITRADGWNIYFNQNWVQYTGLSLEESYGHGWNQPFHPEDKQRAWDAWQQAVKHDGIYELECRLRRVDGEYRWWLIRGVPIKGKQGEITKWFGTCTDINDMKLVQAELHANRELLNNIIHSTPYGVFALNKQQQYILVNTPMTELFGLDAAEILGKTAQEFLPAAIAAQITASNNFIMRTGEAVAAEEVMAFTEQQKHGILEIKKFALRDAQGNITGITGSIQDITEQRLAEQKLRIAATAFDSVLGIIVTDAKRAILQVNSAFTLITGYSQAEVIGKNPRMLQSKRHDETFYEQIWESIYHTGVWKGEIWNQRKNGEIYPEYQIITAVKDNNNQVSHYVATFFDNTERKALEEEIKSLAFYDPLTHLPNRRMLYDRLGQVQAMSKRSGNYNAVLFLDLDNFKALNDQYGHQMGDLLLIEAAERLKNHVREADTVARLGGDEFVVLLQDLDTNKQRALEEIQLIGEKIRLALAEPYSLTFNSENQTQMRMIQHSCTASIGAVIFRNHEESIEDIIKQADIAMYEAKHHGRDRFLMSASASNS
jgi:diguanylate cyclase (GGDEF)-like protein/PAS domain S-box-containing protein